MKKVPGKGPIHARIMFVGEAPGSQEVIEGEPFVGRAGQTLRRYCGMVGIDVEECYLTNLCKFQPPANRLRTWFSKDGIPNEIVGQGLVELIEEINRVKPHVIVACGNFPLALLTGKARWTKPKDEDEFTYTGIYDWRGSILECTLVPGYKVIPTWHPSFIMQQGFDWAGVYQVDLERIKRESEFPEIRLPKKELILNPQGSDRRNVQDRLLGDPSKIVTFDIEYMSKELICVGMTSDRDWATTIRVNQPKDLDFIADCLLAGNGLNAQNAVFDCSILEWHYKMPVIKHLVYDTLLAAHASNIELPKSLDFLCSIYTDQRFYKDMVDWKEVQKGKQDERDLLLYNCIDTWTQHEIMEEQLKWDLNEPGVMSTFKFEMQLVKPLWEMSKRGVRINAAKMVEYREKLEEEISSFEIALMIVAGHPVNVKSNQQIAKLLFDKLGLKPGKMNKTGPAVDDKTLAAVLLRAQTDLQRGTIKLIRDIRNRRDLISKFLDIQFDEDGRMRGHYNPAGTVTGRLASKKFYPTGMGGNQQNIPRNKLVRSMFIPDPGKLFVYADLERAESMVVAYLTQDPEMLRVHGPGVDAHKELAVALFDKALEDITEDERYLGKKTRHAGNYMQGAKTFMTNVNQETAKTGVSIDLGTAAKFIKIYKEIHPFLQHWWDWTEQELWTRHELYNLVGPNGKGRKRIFHGRVDSILPEAVAYVPQSTVGDALNVALLNLEGIECEYMTYLGCWDQYSEWSKELRDLLGYEALMQIHDAVGFQVYEKDVERAVWLANRLMTIPLTIPKTLETFSIPVETMVGPSWGEVKLLKVAA